MKIADFGLARDIHHIDYYKKTTNVNVCFERADQACFVLDDSIHSRQNLDFQTSCDLKYEMF